VLKDHIYEYQRVLIGGGLNAITSAYKTSSYFINNSDNFIFPFDPINNVSDLGLDFRSPADAWDCISYCLNEQGLNPLGKSVFTINVDAENSILEVITKDFNKISIRYENLEVHDLENIYGLPEVQVELLGYRVFDWFDVKSGAKHQYDLLQSEEQFCKKIYFYLSPRIMGNKKYKDLVVESFMGENQLRSADYSSTIARFKTTEIMKRAGILGTGHGQGKFRPIRLEYNRRNIVKKELITYRKEGNIELGTKS
jgi:hypothetical protein